MRISSRSLAKKLIKYLLREDIYSTKVVSPVRIQQFLSAVCPTPIQQKLIRIGAPNDGGYLLPDDFLDIKACFSPGVGEVSKFEEDLADLGIRSFLADGSIDDPKFSNEMLRFIGKYISDQNSETDIRLEDWVNWGGGKEICQGT